MPKGVYPRNKNKGGAAKWGTMTKKAATTAKAVSVLENTPLERQFEIVRANISTLASARAGLEATSTAAQAIETELGHNVSALGSLRRRLLGIEEEKKNGTVEHDVTEATRPLLKSVPVPPVVPTPPVTATIPTPPSV